ncbi:MAG: hypothetical protein N3G19_00090 [Candidatus Pacearchaeota archaeon]|nr:hypothetical protein [Candidatus Pacearchaeota archaeon]
MKEPLLLDIKKLKDEDRRFLLNRNLNKVIANNQSAMFNTTITLSLLALAISCFSVVYVTKISWLIIIYVIIAVIGLGIYFCRYKKAKNYLESEMSKLKINYDALFKHHFNYALKMQDEKNG